MCIRDSSCTGQPDTPSTPEQPSEPDTPETPSQPDSGSVLAEAVSYTHLTTTCTIFQV